MDFEVELISEIHPDPCPFCGCIDISDNGMNVGHAVFRAMWCAKCGASGPGVTRERREEAEAEALRLWNKRACFKK